MRRLIGWMAGLAGVAALAKLLQRRTQPALRPASQSETPSGDPADELRRKLAEARAGTESAAAQADSAAEPTIAEEPGAPDEALARIAARRADVHARAQAAIDAMRSAAE
ncbi:MAG: hypothetical protein U0R50_08075 [Gaiellales bacterium]